MDSFGEQHCRLCLSTLNIKEEDFKEIKDLTESTFDILLLKLNLDNSSKYVTCDVCSRSLLEAFRFKSMCIYTNNTIIPYVGGETDCPIDLKEIYKMESRKKQLIQTLDDYKVCRLCMQLIKDEFVPAHEMAIDMIQMYIPEINLTVVQDPVICRHCFDAFVNHSNFIKNCLEINYKIKSSPQTEIVDTSIWMSTEDSYIKTEEVDIKSENVQEDKLFESDSTMIYEEISNEVDPLKLEDEREERAPSCKQKYNLRRNLLKPKDISKKEGFRTACNLGTKQKSKPKIHHLKHKTRFETKVLECDTCGYKTKFKKSLKRHQLIHKDFSEVDAFQCDTCNYRTKHKSSLKHHRLLHKDITEVEVFECDTCDFKTKYKSYFKVHRLIHKDISEVEAFHCDTCSYRTKHKSHLKNHGLVHKNMSEVKVFKCYTCGYKTKHKYDITKHQLTHKDISEVEVFECDICDFKTKHNSSLKCHQLTHKDISEVEAFECDICDFKTKHKSSLRNHQLTHKDISEVQVFKCDICNYKTKRKYLLTRHQLTHENLLESVVSYPVHKN